MLDFLNDIQLVQIAIIDFCEPKITTKYCVTQIYLIHSLILSISLSMPFNGIILNNTSSITPCSADAKNFTLRSFQDNV